MAFIGNIDGPRESDILEKLGAGFFEISQEALYEDINSHNFAESRSEVTPVLIDENSEPFIKLSGPKIGVIKFYLRENGYDLSGEVTVKNDQGKELIKNI